MTFPSATIAFKPFAAHFDHPLPRGLRSHGEAMTWESFCAVYGGASGPLRLGSWVCGDAGRQVPHARTYQATLAVGDRVSTSSAAACGPVAALTAMLYERGIAVELLGFHQISTGEQTATFINAGDGYHSEWAMGWSQDPTQSALRAVIACANRLLSAP
ncbi:MAG TPA: homocitrate synthase [Mycobacterium sp.]|jgi:hypothetical protein|nr:homocitrate synthase [Mycobacterium sp.]